MGSLLSAGVGASRGPFYGWGARRKGLGVFGSPRGTLRRQRSLRGRCVRHEDPKGGRFHRRSGSLALLTRREELEPVWCGGFADVAGQSYAKRALAVVAWWAQPVMWVGGGALGLVACPLHGRFDPVRGYPGLSMAATLRSLSSIHQVREGVMQLALKLSKRVRATLEVGVVYGPKGRSVASAPRGHVSDTSGTLGKFLTAFSEVRAASGSLPGSDVRSEATDEHVPPHPELSERGAEISPT